MRNIILSLMSFVLLFQNFYAQDQGQSQDKKPQKVTPTIQLGGRIQYDFEFLKQEVDMGENYELNGQEFRRLDLEAGGIIYKNIKYKVQVEFVAGEVAYRDMYIEFIKLPGIGGNLAFGSKAEATGLDMMTSSKYSTFFERAMLTNTQAFRWNSGIHYNNFDILNGQLGLQMSYAFNGDNKEGFIEGNLEEGGHFVARLTSPIYNDKEQKQLVHVGVNFENRKYSKNAADKSLKFRPENHMGEKVTVDFENLKNQNDLGFELAANFGAISFQGEYEMANYKREAETNKVSGYYTALSYFITGERRGFKKGAGSRVKPYKNFCIKDGDLGAIEVVARYSAMDFSDFRTADNELKKVANLSAGFNWYLNSHARLMYNYVTTSFDQQDINNLNGHLIRLQVDF